MGLNTIQISKATEHNWAKLGSDRRNRLTKRANKTQSSKRIIATNYLNNDDAFSLLEKVSNLGATTQDIMYTLSISYLKWAAIYDKEHVHRFLSDYSDLHLLDFQVPDNIWSHNEDVLGFIYQSLMSEGERISLGQYYTNREVVRYILNEKVLADGETFLDPCCGSGAFLLEVKTNTPTCLYGFDIDPIAVLIATTNLLVRFRDHIFTPNIHCIDFLKKDLFSCGSDRSDIPYRFDNVYTNPPWGADRLGQYTQSYPSIKSKERSSMVIAESLNRLNKGGHACFLLPTSILKIKTHNDIRKHLIANTTIHSIDLFTNNFNGVYTDYFCISLGYEKTDLQSYDVRDGAKKFHVTLSKDDIREGQIHINSLSAIDCEIINKMDSQKHDDLSHSRWALGIVTGDNKNKVKKTKSDGFEPIYTGKEISSFNFLKETSYILFDPKSFQQCAKEEHYRASEKLLYRFIAKYPIFAYDDKQRLCLNSANVLIPELDGITIRSAAALLNSTLYRYYYSLKFTDIKVLRGNLQKLPFPKLTAGQNKILDDFVRNIQETEYDNTKQAELDQIIYEIFGINQTEQEHIKQNTDKWKNSSRT